MDRLEEIKARLEAAYPGMWVWNSAGKTIESICDKWTCAIAFEMPEGSQADADFIVHAHNEDIQYLLSEIDRLTAQLGALTEAYDRKTTVHERLNNDYVELKAKFAQLTAEPDAVRTDLGNAERALRYQIQRAARLTAERDAALRMAEAAVKDLFQMQKAIPILSRRCKFCTERSCRDETGLLMVDGGNCRNGDMWEWRDVCAENTEGGLADEV